MKGGVAACVAAARAVRRLGIELEGRLSLHSVIDEEAGSLGAIDAVKRGQRASAVLVAEPTWGDVMPAEGGCEWVRITFRGRNAHASWRYNEIFPQRPDADRMTPGVNAIEIAARFVEALRRYEHERTRERSHPLLPLGVNTMNVGAIHGGSGLGPGGLPLTTTNPAMTPDVAVVDVNVMFLPNETSAEVRRDFEKFVHRFSQTDSWLRDNAPVVRWELSGLFFPPFDTPVDHPLVRSLVRRKSGLGTPPAVRGFVAVTDGAYYANAGMSPVIFGPAGAALHGVDEFVDIDSMVECAKVTASAIIDWCGLK
jgi:acetylornithine deacetylase